MEMAVVEAMVATAQAVPAVLVTALQMAAVTQALAVAAVVEEVTQVSVLQVLDLAQVIHLVAHRHLHLLAAHQAQQERIQTV